MTVLNIKKRSTMNYRNNKILLLIITIFISSYIACQDRLIVLFDETPSISCNVSDVVLLLDSTGSMGSAINSVKSMLTASIIPGLENSVEDLQIGIATYEDIPVGQYGNAGDLPFTVEHKVTDNFTAVQSAVNSITLGNGGDGPESYVEALYLMVTNESFSVHGFHHQAVPGEHVVPCVSGRTPHQSSS